eukprot:SAG31_NODE_323_length_17713_cov_12.065834_15_plen_263_part_00
MHDNVVRFNLVMNIFRTGNKSNAPGPSNQRGIEICDSHYVGLSTSYNNTVSYNIVSNVSGIGLRSKAHAPGLGHGEYQWRWLNNVVMDAGVGFVTVTECIGPNQTDCRKAEQVANNVFFRSRAAHHAGWDAAGTISHKKDDWQHNLYYPDGDKMFCYGLCANGRLPCRNCTNYARFQHDEPHPTHSICNKPPMFVNDSNLPLGLQLLAASPMVRAGLDVGLSYDWLASPVLGTPSIGAFQRPVHNATEPMLPATGPRVQHSG